MLPNLMIVNLVESVMGVWRVTRDNPKVMALDLSGVVKLSVRCQYPNEG